MSAHDQYQRTRLLHWLLSAEADMGRGVARQVDTPEQIDAASVLAERGWAEMDPPGPGPGQLRLDSAQVWLTSAGRARARKLAGGACQNEPPLFDAPPE